MTHFMLVFRGGAVVNAALTDEERRAQISRWTAWADALRARGNFASGGAPLSLEGRRVGADGRIVEGYAVGAELVTGTYAILAANLDEAAEIATRCPILRAGGSIEVRPVLERAV